MNFLRGSLYIGAIRETKIFVHWTFFLLIAWVFISAYREHGDLGQGIISVLFVLVFFACITLHEFGHITVARRYGCYSKKITLLPIGGVASMDKIPEKPLQEMLMALAGPWVNFVIAAFIWLFLWISKGLPSSAVITTLTRDNFLYVLMTANLVVAFFNLIPAFPMDGGRVLRAILAMRFPRERATKIAANVAQVIAVVFVITGLFVNVWLTFIGVFVFLGATSEATAEMTKSLLSHYHVRNVLMHRFTCLSPEEDLESAARKCSMAASKALS
ncbi:MAG TPA: site-2 protease family protein [Bacteroidia bacterium]|nr:site-2 protease family protein [Bacteroidia bacterium]